jgi:hypothetical protein
MDTAIESITRPWDLIEGEPEVWYNIFRDYYLPLGDQRSVRNAFELYLRVEKPKQYEDLDPEHLTHFPQHWGDMAARYQWALRAIEYDKEKVPNFASVYVNQVLEFLGAHATQAAQALVDALRNERTRVQAANSILNRVGVPETTEISLKKGVTFSSDEMAEASKKVDEWKSKKLNG